MVDWPRNAWLSAPNVHRIREIADAAPLVARLADEG
jgi:hypothetical protein